MGRNIFQSGSPVAMISAVRKVVHEGMKPKEAFELYQELKNRKLTNARKNRRLA
jgi:putative autoinducer-2 (AI-2) aldolase